MTTPDNYLDTVLSLIHDAGEWSVGSIWLPTVAWTLVAAAALPMISRIGDNDARLRIGLTLGLLWAYPAVIVTGMLVRIPASWSLVGELRVLQADGATLPQSIDAGSTLLQAPPSQTATVVLMILTSLGFVTCALVVIVAGRVVTLALSSFRLQRLTRSGQLVPDEQSQLALDGIVKQLQIRRPIFVYHARDAHVAYSTGILRRIVVLPAPPTDDLVLWHEALHHVRGDIATTWLIAATASLLGVHPFVRRLCMRAAVDLEILCDRDVLRHAGVHRHTYAQLLIDGARRARVDEQPVLALPLSTSFIQIKHRLEAMNNTTPTRFNIPTTRVASFLLFAVTFVFGACSTAGTEDTAPPVSAVEREAAANQSEARVDESVVLAKISGTITDANGTPLAGAVVTAEGSDKQFVTDENGTYWMILPSGSQDVTVSFSGLSKTTTVELSQSYTRELNVTLGDG